MGAPAAAHLVEVVGDAVHLLVLIVQRLADLRLHLLILLQSLQGRGQGWQGWQGYSRSARNLVRRGRGGRGVGCGV